jgi:hypothetical protein
MLDHPVISKFRTLMVAAPIMLVGMSLPTPDAQPPLAASKHTRFAAVYSIRFAGIKLGKFEVWSNLSDDSYSMRGKGELKFITGLLFEIKGGTTTTGSVTENGPKPSSFSFDFKTKKHRGELAMMFDGNAVSHVMAKPPFVENPTDIPLTSAHVKDVLDPMSALFFTAKVSQQNANGSICPDRLPVFDGKQRFDLMLTHKKTVKIKKKRGKGKYRGTAVVCQIKYVPIAGYKPENLGVKFMTASKDIEVWLIKVDQIGMYVPYHVIIPTPYGKASATSTAFHVEIPGQPKFSVIH